jgi:[ribosomal protein S18]-alanine N-acetyltransferase
MAIEMRVVAPELQQPLAEFFEAIRLSGEPHFHPHQLSEDYARTLAQYAGNDLYYLLLDNRRVLAYGILRGWDQGFEVPSLGIAVLPEARGAHLGELMMNFLHIAARSKGAHHVRLKVYRENASAHHLYTKLGYAFDPVEEEGQLVGILVL